MFLKEITNFIIIPFKIIIINLILNLKSTNLSQKLFEKHIILMKIYNSSFQGKWI